MTPQAYRPHMHPMTCLGLRLLYAPGSLASTQRIIVHVGTSLGDIAFAGLIGGLTIVLGVVVTEILVRYRERRRALHEEVGRLQIFATGCLPGTDRVPIQETFHDYWAFLTTVSSARGHARWPTRHAGEIRAEIDSIYERFVLALADHQVNGTTPDFRSIVGPDLFTLVVPEGSPSVARLNASLQEAGFPPMEKWDEPGAWPQAKGQ